MQAGFFAWEPSSFPCGLCQQEGFHSLLSSNHPIQGKNAAPAPFLSFISLVINNHGLCAETTALKESMRTQVCADPGKSHDASVMSEPWPPGLRLDPFSVI